MRIANSNVAMASQRRYVENGRQTVTSGRQNIIGMMSKGMLAQSASQNQWADMLSLSTDEDGGGSSLSDTYDKNHGVRKLGRAANPHDLAMNMNSFRDSLLNEMLGRFKSIGFDVSGLTKQTSDGLGIWAAGGTGGLSFSELSYYEEEYTSFSAEGMAMTEDGRQIDFNLQMEMSRSFSLYTKTEIPMLASVFQDPLVVNVGGSVTSISDQKFRFDIDVDGILDEISMPTTGSGFLALDKNGDGTINDGSELFGTKSGDGFKDLAEYDSDGNGWIDENDEIFDKLMIWYKNGDGKDELIDLKEADIGAIYLGEQSTTFKLQGTDFNTNGMVRSTGIFLHESTGLAGTIQHVDLAVGGKMDPMANAAVYEVGDGDAVEVDPNAFGTDAQGAEEATSSVSTVTESEERSKKSERESEEERRREKRLKRKQEDKTRLERRRAEKERMEKLHKKQVERKEEMDARWERKRKERMNSEKAARAERIAEEEQEEIKTRADDEAEQISVTEIGTFENATEEGVIL